ncbi:hypothetical protein BT63DRAFT_246062 [Microthyrium microscopicum]|uniref:Uncharacterized protein n=1 Tax=Microthyrium microscopicum TaxID=703497 RepID=A0A6A6UAF4_9PEZI|nr:hypothetical protein BT63DRAFT_246062 [Microthyrium microscopicum]
MKYLTLLNIILAILPFISADNAATADCCFPVSDDRNRLYCADGTLGTPYCGKGGCNRFGCNCDGGNH